MPLLGSKTDNFCWLEPLHSEEVHIVIEPVGGRLAIDGPDYWLGPLKLEEKVVGNAHLDADPTPREPPGAPLPGLRLEQGRPTVVDEDEELEDLAPSLA